MLLRPAWPAPSSVCALTTDRRGLINFPGVSVGAYEGFNLADHVGDQLDHVAENRRQLVLANEGLCEVAYLQQVHGTDVARITDSTPSGQVADASITRVVGTACSVLTADCLPVLFCDLAGREVAAAHAGWRGLCGGVLKATVEQFSSAPEQLMAWIGPGISAANFEVGAEVFHAFREQFSAPFADIERAFKPSKGRAGHYHADLAALAKSQLESLGLAWVGGGEHCSYTDSTQFYSYRRDGVTGRQATLIYLKD